MRDVTEDIKTPSTLNNFNSLFSSSLFYEHTAVMLIIDSNTQHIIDANKSALDYYGYAIEDFKDMSYHDILGMRDSEIEIELANAKKLDRKYFSMKHILKCGEIRDVEVYTSKITIQGKLLDYSIVFDVTDRKIAEKALKLANADLSNSNNIISQQLVNLNSLNNKLLINEKRLTDLNSSKDRFFSIIAHDLKEPLIGFTQRLKVISSNFFKMNMIEIQNSTKAVHESAVNLYQFLENLLEWARIQQGNFRFYFNDYDLSSIARRHIDLFKDAITLKHLNIINEIAPNTFVYTDEHMVASIVSNLLHNAIKFSNINSTIIISCSSFDKQKIQVMVEDHGIGMDVSILQKLFKLDYRIKRDGTMGEKGSGLGLILCKDLVEKCGGIIWAESTEDIGSKLYFTLMKSNIEE